MSTDPTAAPTISSSNIHSRSALIDGYRAHYGLVRNLVPQSQLIEFDAKDGWAPLCHFLGKEAPKDEKGEETPYPRENQGTGVVRLHEFLYWIRLVKCGGKALVLYLGPVALSWVAWYLVRK